MAKIVFLLLFFALNHAQGSVDVEINKGFFRSHLSQQFRLLSDYDSRQNYQAYKCRGHFTEILNKGLMDIRYAIGYKDLSFGDDDNDGEYSMAVDQATFEVVSDWLQRDCRFSEGHSLCGFNKTVLSEGSHIYSKRHYMFGQSVLVNIHLTKSSLTPYHKLNTVTYRQEQKQMSEQAELNFFDGLKQADIVFYNGHARDGGGPDFRPPVLRSYDLKPNYDGHYRKYQTNFKRMLQALEQRPHSNQIVGIFACYTGLHFQEAMELQAPGIRLILSHAKPNFSEATSTSLAYLDGLLMGLCGEELGQRARRTRVSQQEYFDLRL